MADGTNWVTHMLAVERRVRLRRISTLARRASQPALGIDPQARIGELEQALHDIISIANGDKE